MSGLMEENSVGQCVSDIQRGCLKSNLVKVKVKHLLYQPPKITKIYGMRFPLDILESTGGVVCKQCSGCHTCR